MLFYVSYINPTIIELMNFLVVNFCHTPLITDHTPHTLCYLPYKGCVNGSDMNYPILQVAERGPNELAINYDTRPAWAYRGQCVQFVSQCVIVDHI